MPTDEATDIYSADRETLSMRNSSHQAFRDNNDPFIMRASREMQLDEVG